MRSYKPTVAQELIWLDQVISSGSAKYNIGGYAQLDGDLVYDRFNRAIREVLRTQEAYSTTFSDVEGRLQCEVGDWTGDYSMAILDFSGAPDPEGAAFEWMEKNFALSFEIDNGLLFYFRLLKIGNRKHYWYAKIHHLISDGWSFKLLLNQASECYDSLMKGNYQEGVVYRYSDYSLEDEEYYRSEGMRNDREFWLNEYKTLPDALFKKSYTANRDFQTAGSETLIIPPELKSELQVFAQERKASLFQLVITMILIYFSRTSGQNEIAMGVPVLNRTKKAYRHTSGVFMNLLALKYHIRHDATVLDILNLVKQKMSQTLRHQRYQYGNLVNDLKLPLSNLIYDIRVSYEDFDFVSDFGGLSAKAVALSNYSEVDKLAIYMRDYHDQGFDVRFVYNVEYFDKEAMKSICKNLKYLMASLGGLDNVPLSQLQMLDPDEVKRIMELSAGPVKERRVRNVIELWNEAVGSNREQAAISFRDTVYSYEDIDFRSKSLARVLAGKRHDAADTVAIVLSRSEKMIISMLGSMMAGMSYIPLDTEYPDERIKGILSDANCRILITCEGPGYRFEGLPGLEIVNVDALPGVSGGREAEEPDGGNGRGGDGQACCYIIYTSGSSGKPKGVKISNRSMADYVQTFTEYFSIGKGDVVLQQCSLSFDASVEEIFPVLCAGGRLHILEDHRDLLSLYQALETEKITVLSSNPYVPKFLNELALPSTLRIIISGGDVLKPEYVSNILRQGIAVYNTYGPTESTVCVTYYRVKGDERFLPIGRPITNRETFIVDRNMGLAPLGIEGEILMGGEGLALGYLNDEGRTGEKFIEDSPINGKRLYKSGDIGIMLHDGNILFRGRKDDQLKFRGYRIEAQEVEQLICAVDHVESCVVAVREFQDSPLLAGYIKLRDGQALDAEALSACLRDRVPDFMIPEVWVSVNEFPVLLNGKMNRRDLPQIEPWMVQGKSKRRRKPETIIEIRMADIWKDVLGLEEVGADESFFDLGGHSLNIMRLVNRYHQEFEVKLAVKELFLHRTIGSHAVLIEERTKTGYSPIPQVAVSEDYAVSDGQRRLWILSQLEESSRAYTLIGHLELEGEYSAAYFGEAIRVVIERHEILRTVFRENEQGELRQVILQVEEAGFRLTDEDVEGWPADKVKEYIREESMRVFDLSQGPLVRAGLLRLGEKRYIFYYNMHHIISDGVSMEILGREVMAYYNSFIGGVGLGMPALRIQYKDYTAWQQEQLGMEGSKVHRSYWLEQLGGVLPVLDLPGDKARPAVLTHNGYRISTVIGKEMVEGLRGLCQRGNGTMFMGLLAVLDVLLYRYTGQEDIIIGSPVAGREHAELENQIGFYLNTLALRTRFSGEESTIALLGRVREMTLQAYEHQMYPFDRLVGELDLKRDMSRSALFDIVMVLQNQQERRVIGREKGIGVGVEEPEFFDEDIRSVKFDLHFEFVETGDELRVNIEFNTDIYQKESIVGMVRHYKSLLAAMVAAPERPVSRVEYLTQRERERLLVEFNDTAVDYPRDRTMVDLFEEQVRRTPRRVAVVYEGEEMTYEELDRRTKRLGRYLQGRGVRAETLVPICMDRGIGMIVGILGILKAGGAYVPLDPDYPMVRLRYMLKDSGGSVVVSSGAYGDMLREAGAEEVVLLDGVGWEEESEVQEDRLLGPDHLAYVIYTSGTTGMPKGVMIEHKGLVNRLLWAQRYYKLGEGDRILQKTNYCFDVSVWELLWPLLAGSRLVFARPGGHKDNVYLKSIIEEQGITVLHFVPSMLDVFLKEITTGECKTLRKVLCSGEALKPEHAELFRKKLPHAQLHNLYGPTEASIDVTYWSMPEGEEEPDRIPIGKPIDNLQLYILGADKGLVPVGISGEICIGGVGLARGYLNKPELTAEKFIHDPFREGTGERLYRTGDLGRWREDGMIEYMGRMDDQVKIRGFRIELGEVEHALREVEGIGQAVVVAGEVGGGRSLIAYLVSEVAPGVGKIGEVQEVGKIGEVPDVGKIREVPDVGKIRKQLLDRLPEYMIPGYYVKLEAMPLNANGKIDRKALPSPGKGVMGTGREYVGPGNEMEAAIVRIYEEMLNVKNISLNDNYFDLGGNSILLMKIRREIKQQIGVYLNIGELYKISTIKEVAEAVGSIKWLQQGVVNRPEQQKIEVVI
ncbi:MAG TPA: amino acid adenylation domain-containing protein [Puia sp.]|jgi:amino acid adenylation domain-containing protein|nr:amino acid adenylation domain-containing protein [Puia sp.]